MSLLSHAERQLANIARHAHLNAFINVADGESVLARVAAAEASSAGPDLLHQHGRLRTRPASRARLQRPEARLHARAARRLCAALLRPDPPGESALAAVGDDDGSAATKVRLHEYIGQQLAIAHRRVRRP